eukprot:NODE_6446_length_884_cov_39.124836_g5853_i0.p1 GENE.NODE_6446_length_884_cov_39.124836_g5853_i0~~NODE_6446_length_884_cov_39.124836_g5853_i0.p1  ORF type:complete len:234 (-),score=21.65 NODE_6446_length_884_cov_39.124836_g5853_i0:100-801(-)
METERCRSSGPIDIVFISWLCCFSRNGLVFQLLYHVILFCAIVALAVFIVIDTQLAHPLWMHILAVATVLWKQTELTIVLFSYGADLVEFATAYNLVECFLLLVSWIMTIIYEADAVWSFLPTKVGDNALVLLLALRAFSELVGITRSCSHPFKSVKELDLNDSFSVMQRSGRSRKDLNLQETSPLLLRAESIFGSSIWDTCVARARKLSLSETAYSKIYGSTVDLTVVDIEE